MSYTATYSPDDNKIRIEGPRFDADTLARVKAAGYRWAPKQQQWIAPMWTPDRADLAIDLAGEILDDDRTLMDRAEDRAERFDDYSEKRANEATAAHAAVKRIADGIPFGQPILVGHHSERHARKDAERIENGMRRAVKAFETSEYWTRRAAAAIGHAKYKELPAVRARRIKTIEAEARKWQRSKTEAAGFLAAWTAAAALPAEQQHPAALAIANRCWLHLPRIEGDRPDFTQSPTAYDALTNSHPSLYAPRELAEIFAHAAHVYPASIARYDRWLDHLAGRLAYERTMLAEAGGTVADKTGPEVGGACRCWASPRGGWSYIQKINRISVTVLDNWGNGGESFPRVIPFDKLHAVMSRAEVAEAKVAGRVVELPAEASGKIRGFGLRDPYTPPPDAPAPPQDDEPATGDRMTAADRDALRGSLKAGVQVAAVPQLFPTPRPVAEQLIRLADIQPGDRVLEPSAGTGALLGAMGGQMFGHNPERGAVVAVEIDRRLADRLRIEYPLTTVHARDFLELEPADLGTFDVIVMNPPFGKGADIAHIEHARRFLNPGGQLVAVCANGPRQGAAFADELDRWIPLPAGSFSDQGTNVNTAIVVFVAPAPTRSTSPTAAPAATLFD